jgi:hypothetical protein
MHINKFTNIINSSAQDRYKYFVRKVADSELIWGLVNNTGSWFVATSSEGETVYPLWPEREFAEAAATGDWSSAKSQSINIDEFIDSWLPGMQNKGEKVGVFWHPIDLIGIDVDPSELLIDLKEEIEQYE